MKWDFYYKKECVCEADADTFAMAIKKAGFPYRKVSNLAIEIEENRINKKDYDILMEVINAVDETGHSLVVRQVE